MEYRTLDKLVYPLKKLLGLNKNSHKIASPQFGPRFGFFIHLKLSGCQSLTDITQILAKSFFSLQLYNLKYPKKVPGFLGYLCRKICYQEFSKSPNLLTLDSWRRVNLVVTRYCCLWSSGQRARIIFLRSVFEYRWRTIHLVLEPNLMKKTSLQILYISLREVNVLNNFLRKGIIIMPIRLY